MSTPQSRWEFLSKGWDKGGHPHMRDEGFDAAQGVYHPANPYRKPSLTSEPS